MPTLIVKDVPPEIYERLQKRAAQGQRTLPEETLLLLKEILSEDRPPSRRLPDLIPTEETPVYGDLPRSSQPVTVHFSNGLVRLPDPLPSEVPG